MTSLPTLPILISEAELLTMCKRQVSLFAHSRSGPLPMPPPQLAARVAQIIWRNLHSGRVRRALGRDERRAPIPLDWLERYVDRVISHYLDEHERVERLADGDSAEWERLQRRLCWRACKMLQHWSRTSLTAQDAVDFAQQTCVSIYHATFSYDVAFDAWATLILKNDILKRFTRSKDIIDRNLRVESLDQSHPGHECDGSHSLYDTLADPASEALFESVDAHEQVKQAIAQLPNPSQRQVVTYTFLLGRSDEWIAREMGRSRQAVYNLRHRAIQQLRQIMSASPQE
ncbi:MAG TPA: RNA polymerase sigma factor [Anaerolineae bacterium]|nr:RNA polymerase sigma factor [Anaerolineae bacterium]